MLYKFIGTRMFKYKSGRSIYKCLRLTLTAGSLYKILFYKHKITSVYFRFDNGSRYGYIEYDCHSIYF